MRRAGDLDFGRAWRICVAICPGNENKQRGIEKRDNAEL